MSDKLKYFLYGVSTGVAVGFIVKAIIDKKKEKEEPSEIPTTDEYQELLDELNKENNEKAERMITEEQNRKKEEIFTDYENRAAKYSPLIHSDEDGASYDFDDEMKEINEEIEEQDMKRQEKIDKGYNTNKNCYFIYPDDYTDDGLNDGIELVFCPDGVLVRVDDESVTKPEILFDGDIKFEDICRKFEMEGYDTIYVRKERNGIDYAIEWTDKSYKEAFGE